MRGRVAIYLALGASLGVVGAYLIAGGASYQPLEAADPCEPRPAEVLTQRGVFEGIVLSALDGAACELQVSREGLTAALSDEESLSEFAEERDLTEEDVDDAVRAGVLRAVEDAAAEGRLPESLASITRTVAENLPISLVLDLFRALPGDPSLPEVLQALQEIGIGIGELDELLEGALDQLEGSGLEGLLPGPDALGELAPEELQPLLPGTGT